MCAVLYVRQFYTFTPVWTLVELFYISRQDCLRQLKMSVVLYNPGRDYRITGFQPVTSFCSYPPSRSKRISGLHFSTFRSMKGYCRKITLLLAAVLQKDSFIPGLKPGAIFLFSKAANQKYSRHSKLWVKASLKAKPLITRNNLLLISKSLAGSLVKFYYRLL